MLDITRAGGDEWNGSNEDLWFNAKILESSNQFPEQVVQMEFSFVRPAALLWTRARPDFLLGLRRKRRRRKPSSSTGFTSHTASTSGTDTPGRCARSPGM